MSLLNADVVSSTQQASIDEWMAEIAKLPPRKQKNWKGHLYDKWNVSQRVRYVPGGRTIGEGPDALTTYFEVWKQANREKGHAWWPVLSHESLHDAGTYLPMSRAGLRLMTAADPLEEFNEIQGENMTGNHYRNHFIKVPTAPGEPVRG